MNFNKIYNPNQLVSIAPLASFRIIFGLAMAISTLRFIVLDWIEKQYIETQIHFQYFGFGWLPYPSQNLIYILFIVLLISSLAIFIGYKYNYFKFLFFISFNYIELLDVSYYLNHYYFVSLISILLLFIPASKNYSIDSYLSKSRINDVPRWTIDILKFQLGIVYFYAGLAKINHDWIFEALPLKIWLPAQTDMPLLGYFFEFKQTAYLFSWVGLFFDLSIVFFMLSKKTRFLAYLTIIIFHSLTGYMFQIGVFPLIMSSSMLLFFSSDFHIKLLKKFENKNIPVFNYSFNNNYIKYSLLTLYIIFNLTFPFRNIPYPCNLFWTEEGYRFSWRVMLVEKTGYAIFLITNPKTGEETAIINSDFLNEHQEKQMSFQPDLILQFAHKLQKIFSKENNIITKVRAEVYVSLQGKPSQLLFNPQINLCEIEDTWKPKKWLNCNND